MGKLLIVLFLLPCIGVFCQNSKNAVASFYRLEGLHMPDAGTTIDADAQRFFDSAGITDATQKQAVNRLVLDLKGVTNSDYYTANVWLKLKGIYPLVGGSAYMHQWNLKNPVNADTAYRLTFYGTLTMDANGVTGNNGGYADTHYIADSIPAANQFSMGEYVRSATTTGNFNCGYYNSGGSGNFVTFLNNGTSLQAVYLAASYGPASSGYGPAILSWDGTNAYFACLSELSGARTPNSSAQLNGMGDLTFLGYRSNSYWGENYSYGNFSFFFFGNYLTQAEMLAVSNAISRCQVTLGRSVNF